MATASDVKATFGGDVDDVRLVMPNAAKKYLSSSDDHPFVSKNAVAKHVRDIRNGIWQSPVHTVTFFPDGEVASGHEYLRAIVESNIPGYLFFDDARADDGRGEETEETAPASPALTFSSRVETITPELAREYLTRNHENRIVRWSKVRQFAADMTAGKWKLTNQGIGFNEAGDLDDGQHRLLAVIESGVPQDFLVVRGMRDARLAIDCGTNRSTKDVFDSLKLGKKCTNVHVSTASAMYLGFRSAGGNQRTRTSRYFWVEFINKYYANIDFASTSVTGRVGQNSSFRGAIARAHRFEDQELLSRFSNALSTGIMEDKYDTAAIILRNHFLANARHYSNQVGRQKLHGMTEGAIRSFFEQRESKIVRGVKKEVYPIDEDKS